MQNFIRGIILKDNRSDLLIFYVNKEKIKFFLIQLALAIGSLPASQKIR